MNSERERQHREAVARRQRLGLSTARRAIYIPTIRSPKLDPKPKPAKLPRVSSVVAREARSSRALNHDAHVRRWRYVRACLGVGTIAFRAIVAATAKEAGVREADILSGNRCGWASLPRQMALYIATSDAGYGLSCAGRRIRRDHTTVLYAKRIVAARMVSEPAILDLVIRIRLALEIDA